MKLNHDPAFIYGQPPWLLQCMQDHWPNEWQTISAENDAHPPMVLRVNVREKSAQEYHWDTLGERLEKIYQKVL